MCCECNRVRRKMCAHYFTEKIQMRNIAIMFLSIVLFIVICGDFNFSVPSMRMHSCRDDSKIERAARLLIQAESDLEVARKTKELKALLMK